MTFPISILNILFSGIFFFPSTITEQNNLDFNVGNSESYPAFKEFLYFKKILKSFKNSISNSISNRSWTDLIITLRLGFSHVCEHKFRHNFQFRHDFQDTFNLIAVAEEIPNCYSLYTSLSQLFKYRNNALEQPTKYWRKYSWQKWFPSFRDASFQWFFI